MKIIWFVRAIQYIKKRYKNEIGIMCDVALDPYTSHGHDGLLKSRLCFK